MSLPTEPAQPHGQQPPVVAPWTTQPHAEPAPPPRPTPARLPRAVIVAVSVVALLAAAAAGWAGGAAYTRKQQTDAADTQQTAEHAAQLQRLSDTAKNCGGGMGLELADNGRTLTIDGQGKSDFDGLPVTSLDCVLNRLKVPEAVRQQMVQTRALDGRQEASWEVFKASWSYHPDDGLDLVVTAD